MPNLSQHFTQEEMLFSETAKREKIPNLPTAEVSANLKKLCERMEKVRELLGGHSIKVNSGFRCIPLNRKVGSKDTSDHVKGLAIDFTCAQFGTPTQICQKIWDSDIKFKQVICEGTWVHLAIGATPNQDKCEKLVAHFHKGAATTYTKA